MTVRGAGRFLGIVMPRENVGDDTCATLQAAPLSLPHVIFPHAGAIARFQPPVGGRTCLHLVVAPQTFNLSISHSVDRSVKRVLGYSFTM